MGIAVPNVISTINNNKRNNFLLDAKRMVSTAKYLISSNKEDRDKVLSGENKVYKFEELNEKDEYKKDADAGEFIDNTYVKVSHDDTNNEYQYCICVEGSKRIISKSESKTPNPKAEPCPSLYIAKPVSNRNSLKLSIGELLKFLPEPSQDTTPFSLTFLLSNKVGL